MLTVSSNLVSLICGGSRVGFLQQQEIPRQVAYRQASISRQHVLLQSHVHSCGTFKAETLETEKIEAGMKDVSS